MRTKPKKAVLQFRVGCRRGRRRPCSRHQRGSRQEEGRTVFSLRHRRPDAFQILEPPSRIEEVGLRLGFPQLALILVIQIKRRTNARQHQDQQCQADPDEALRNLLPLGGGTDNVGNADWLIKNQPVRAGLRRPPESARDSASGR